MSPSNQCASAQPSLDFFPDCCIQSASGKPDEFGYTRLSLTKGRYARAHRIAYRMFKGAIPHGMVVMHTCDNPWCINPKHLAIGTHGDNYADMRTKERYRRGEGVYLSKLTEDNVRKILLSSSSLSDLAKEYGVSKSAIWSVINRRTWKHVQVEGVNHGR